MKFENPCGKHECSVLKVIKEQRFDEYDQIKKEIELSKLSEII